ncbi:MAG: YicC family protein [Clostridiales bacterium]|nr:YicC family protein [Clostridiales bacterium]MBQ2818681.1 YicC family protein [Clostridia bacterium]MBQ4637391.1 YicC family protein [Clostridia bacterium]
MNSMTGFGRGTCCVDGREITIELKSVNHRFLDLSFRMPRAMSYLEDELRKLLQGAFTRGHIDVYLTYQNTRTDSKQALVDVAAIEAYQKAVEQINELGVPGKLSVQDVLRIPDAVKLSDNQDDQEAIIGVVRSAFADAAAQMKAGRAQEGARLMADIDSRLDIIMEKRDMIAKREPLVVSEYKDKLKARLEQLMGDVALDEARLIQEVAIFADKASIAEELTRIISHVKAIRETYDQSEATGRRLDFIVQELNRETNTIGSKASDITIAQLVVDIKAEIEKIREQVQNIE